MSTFSGLGTALSSLTAQRQALEVSGQNIANANTVGYTRQRADLTSVNALAAPSLHSSGPTVGNGARVTGIARLGDMFLDARLRAETSSSSFQSAQASALGRLESLVKEPGSTSVSASLQTFWGGWSDLANNPGDTATRTALLGDAAAVVDEISRGYRAVETQWQQMRTQLDTVVTDVNTTADAIAHLNEQIRSIRVSGGTANELVDQRSLLVTELSGLVGATAREREDGTLDVMVSGNPLVSGVRAEHVAVVGSQTMAGGIGEVPAAHSPVGLVWADGGTPLALQGGSLASNVATLAKDGPLGTTIAMWNGLATTLASDVNGAHGTGQDLDGNAATAFFTFGGSTPPALGLTVAITDPRDVAAAAGGNAKGALDGSVADAVAKLATSTTGADQQWKAFVVDLGVQSKAATSRATVLEASRATAENLQLSGASVDLDEESVNMLAYQRAYEGAARVLTAVDEMLDTLINRTGVVGR